MELDHLVVAARNLDEGSDWVAARLGAAPTGGGKHAAMGTHNRLLSLGPDAYLEVIAIDPDAPPPRRPRWFSLDGAAMQARLAQGPALIHWVARTDDIERDVGALHADGIEVLAMQRGDFRWRIGVPRDGALFEKGTRPTLIQWDGPRPTTVLPDVGIRLQQLLLRREGGHGDPLRASFQTQRGTAWLPE